MTASGVVINSGTIAGGAGGNGTARAWKVTMVASPSPPPPAMADQVERAFSCRRAAASTTPARSSAARAGAPVWPRAPMSRRATPEPRVTAWSWRAAERSPTAPPRPGRRSFLAASEAVHGSATVTNLGTVAGAGSFYYGVSLEDGGRVTNGGASDSTALITYGLYLGMNAAATVVNFGTIQGQCLFRNPGGRLVAEAGSTITSLASCDGGGTLELVSGRRSDHRHGKHRHHHRFDVPVRPVLLDLPGGRGRLADADRDQPASGRRKPRRQRRPRPGLRQTRCQQRRPDRGRRGVRQRQHPGAQRHHSGHRPSHHRVGGDARRERNDHDGRSQVEDLWVEYGHQAGELQHDFRGRLHWPRQALPRQRNPYRDGRRREPDHRHQGIGADQHRTDGGREAPAA